jgi:hypothetical protein
MKSIGFASLTFIALSASQLSAAPAIGSASPTVDRPLSEMSQNALKVPRKILLGDLVVNKAQARVYPGAAVGLPSPKVQLQVSYCAKKCRGDSGGRTIAGEVLLGWHWPVWWVIGAARRSRKSIGAHERRACERCRVVQRYQAQFRLVCSVSANASARQKPDCRRLGSG